MPLEFPRHSTEPHCEVYHNHTDCTEANNIEKKNFAFGVGSKRLCKHCEDLANKDALAQKSIVEYHALKSRGLFGGGSGLKNSLLASFKPTTKK